MAGSLERHRLKDDEALQVPPPVKHPPQIPYQDVEKTSPHLPAWRLVATRWRDREVTSPSMPRLIFCDPAVQMCARVPVNPVPVDLPET